jgi:hypothetical protein
MESTENHFRPWKTRGLKNRQFGKLMETRPNPVDARVGAFVSLCPSFFFLFNNLKKKKKGEAARAGRWAANRVRGKTGAVRGIPGGCRGRFSLANQ